MEQEFHRNNTIITDLLKNPFKRQKKEEKEEEEEEKEKRKKEEKNNKNKKIFCL